MSKLNSVDTGSSKKRGNVDMEHPEGKVCPISQSRVGSLFISTPIGMYEVKVCNQGIHNLGLTCNRLTKENFNPAGESKEVQIDKEMSTVVVDDDDEPKKKRGKMDAAGIALEWMKTFFANPTKLSADIPQICLPPEESTKFERDVWNTLASSTLFGKTVTYAGLAALIGNPKASRAVGTALKKNPVGLIIPCHRVVRSNGTTGNYAGGKLNIVKEWLLEYEKAQ